MTQPEPRRRARFVYLSRSTLIEFPGSYTAGAFPCPTLFAVTPRSPSLSDGSQSNDTIRREDGEGLSDQVYRTT